MNKGLKAQPFTDTQLQEMAITFPECKSFQPPPLQNGPYLYPLAEQEMLEIERIQPEMVRIHGARFLKLVQKSRQFYENMRRQEHEDCLQDPNHQNVIDLISDEEVDGDNIFEQSQESDQSQRIESKFFQRDAQVDDFNSQLADAAGRAPMRAQSASASSRGRGNGNGWKKKPRPFSKGGKGTSCGASKGKKPNGVSKNNSTSNRSSMGSFAGGPSKRAGGGGGIGMMPT